MAKRTKKKQKGSRLYLILLPLALVVASGILYFSSNKFISEFDCGCGYPGPVETGQFQENSKLAIFNDHQVFYKMAKLTPVNRPLDNKVLGQATDERWIEVDLSDQKLYAHNGNSIDYEFLVSSGKWAPTPTGDFRIWMKLRYTKMEGGNKEAHTYYYLPNVPYTQYFYKGYGLHGAYWHNNFGHPMSHGCINLAIPDAEKLFYWTSPAVPDGKGIVRPSPDEPGTRVVVHD